MLAPASDIPDFVFILIALIVISALIVRRLRARQKYQNPFQHLHHDAEIGGLSSINDSPTPPRFLQGSSPLAQLSEREIEITQLVAQGLTNKQIAAHTGLSINTVQSHLRRIFVKLGVHSRIELSMRVAPYLADGDS